MDSVDRADKSIVYSGIDNLEIMRDARNYNAFLISQVSHASRGARSALDFGAGLGAFALPLRASGQAVDTVETDPDLKSELRGHGFTVFSNTKDLPNDKYDFIYSLNVLEHIEDDRAVIDEFYRLLAPGGCIYIYLPAFNMLWSSMDEKVGHFRRYGRRDLEEKIKSSGFKIEKCIYADFMGFLATIAFKVIGNKRGDLNRKSIRIFDRFIFPFNMILDPIFGRVMGKNIHVVARK